MRAALIILPDTEADPFEVAGRTIARHQLEFALETGCKTIIMQGNGASPQALALRNRAEAAHARVAIINDPLALSGLLSPSDDLLVMQPGLLPVARDAPALTEGEPHILVLPGGAARPGSFERIDLQRAWGGAMVVPGGMVEGLRELGDGIDAPSSLLRLALQYGLKEREIPPDWLDSSSWIIASPDRADALSARWLDRALAPVSAFAPSRWIGRMLARWSAPKLAGRDQAGRGIATLSALLAAIAVALGWYEFDWAASVLAGTAAVCAWMAIAVQRLLSMPFGRSGRFALVRWLPDVALLAVSIMAIDGTWAERLFPPLILFAALRFLPPLSDRMWLRLTRDRLLISLLLAILASVGQAEKGVMLVALFALLPTVRFAVKNRG